MKRIFGLLAMVALFIGVDLALAQNPGQPGKVDPGQKGAQPPKGGKATSGLLLNDPKALQGFTLFSPMSSNKSFLVDMEGKVVHSWQGAGNPALCAYLLPNGNLLRTCVSGGGGFSKGFVAGAGGRIQEIAWDGTVVWDYKFPIDKMLPHHDAVKLPNGNVLAIVMLQKSAQDALAVGRKGSGSVNADGLVEIKPRGKDGGDIVWQWHAWEHTIQDNDAAKANHGKVEAHPELININFGGAAFGGGGAGGKGKDGGKGGGGSTDWTHFNGIAYNAELDQIMISVHSFSEFWIIDHSTTMDEAAGHKGGKSGKGGDLLYRWGNPRAYSTGGNADQQLFAQHNAHWIPAGLPGAGHVLLFNNGLGRQGATYSSVDEIVLPVDEKGVYTVTAGKAYGPAKAVWNYTAEKKGDFNSTLISGAQRLANGNTLICSGQNATVFEITSTKEVVWKYIPNIAGGAGGPGGGKGPGGFDPKGFDPKGFDPKGFDPKGAFDPKALEQKKDFGQPPGGGPGGGSGGTQLFRANRYALDYTAFAGRTLTPAKTGGDAQPKAKGK